MVNQFLRRMRNAEARERRLWWMVIGLIVAMLVLLWVLT
jgi:hypothetical protein